MQEELALVIVEKDQDQWKELLKEYVVLNAKLDEALLRIAERKKK